MSTADVQQRYGIVAICLHWLIALCVICVVGLALTIERLDMGETKTALTTLHKSVGLTIFMLTAARLGWRLAHPAPALPQNLSALMRRAAFTTHAVLYVLTFAMPVSGYISVAARARDTTFFWVLDIPRWVPLDRGLARTAEMVHTNGQYVLYALLVGHVGAALYHGLLLKDGVFQRMWLPHR